MKKTVLYYPVSIAVLTLFIISCGSQQLPASTSSPVSKTQSPPAKTESRPSWEIKWTKTLGEARKEGKLMVYSLWSPDTRTAVSQGFREKFGIEAEFTPFGRGAELLARVVAEKRAGLQIPDVFGAGGPTFITSMKPAGVLGQIKPLLFLPEVVDSKMWKGGRLPFSDKEGHTIAMLAAAQRFMIYNTDLVKKGELTSYEDALKRQYKGEISLNDPRVTGSGNAFFSHLALNVWNVERAKEYLTQLVRDQKAEIIRDNRVQVESVARGKYSIGLGGRIATQADFMDAGAPIAQVLLKDVFISHGDGVLGVPTVSPHPNATLIFLNWLLSREGQAVYVRNTGNPGLRTDAPEEGINPIFFPRPEEELFLDSEEAILFRGKMRKVASEAIAQAGKT